ncbi:MAG TPA: nuclear transport factor 2 family protein [Gemmatimonadaceae bacterium]|nr:nuclear transport factor 2 family protein [Gemmatimonadaceae bacterium]
MRLLSLATLSLGLAASPLAAQPVARALSTTERTLTRLENEWTRALVQRDTASFRRLLAPRFVYTEDAQVMGKDDVIRGVVGPDRVEWAGNEDMIVHDYGSTAVVTGILAVRGTGANGAFARRYRYTDTWLRTNGRWRVIAAQDYLIPK